MCPCACGHMFHMEHIDSESASDVMRWLQSEAAVLWPAFLGSLSLRRSRCVRPNCAACLSGEQHQSYVLYDRAEGRRICGRYFEAWGVIMMPSHDIGVQGRELCSDRRSTCDCSRRAASRYLVGSPPRLTHSTAHKTIACGVSCHSPRQISCGAS
jgi:hypothetical protein